MLPHIIWKDTPQALYARVVQNSKNDFVCNPYSVPDKSTNYADMSKSTGYKLLLRTMINLLKATGIGVVILIILFLIEHFAEISFPAPLMLTLVVLTVGVFFLSLILGAVGAVMESTSEKKDTHVKELKQQKTFFLRDGKIAVSDEQHKGRMQKFSFDTDLSDDYIEKHSVPIPFNNLDIIDKVYSVNQTPGKITARVHCQHYYLHFLYRDDDGNSLVDFVYEFRRRNCTATLTWYCDEFSGRYLMDSLAKLR